MHRILCSTGAIITRSNGRDHRLLADIAPQLGCDGFEFMMYSSWYDDIETIADDINTMRLSIPVFHCDKQIGELITAEDKKAFTRFEQNCRAAEMLGAETLVLHLWNGTISDSNFSANLSALEKLCLMAEKFGLTLTVENLVCAYGIPSARLKELKEIYPDISFTFDTKMAEFHGELFSAFDNDLYENIRHLHINDYSGGIKEWSALKTLHIGQGQVDFENFFSKLSEYGYNGDFTVEATSVNVDGSVDIDKLNQDFSIIKGYIA